MRILNCVIAQNDAFALATSRLDLVVGICARQIVAVVVTSGDVLQGADTSEETVVIGTILASARVRTERLAHYSKDPE